MEKRFQYQICGKRLNGKTEVLAEPVSITYASSFIKNQRRKYEKLGFMYLFALPLQPQLNSKQL
jgi:hypothetical protein